jgi:outer membrane protein assembly factor BamA
MPRIIRTFSGAVLVFSSVLSMRAQEQLLKPQSVRFDGTQEYTSSELLAVTGIKKGAVYTSGFLAQSAQKLMASGVFDKVSYKFDGAELVYLLSDNPDLYPVIIDNLPLDPTPNLDAELRKDIPLYHGKVPSEGSMLDSVRQALGSMLSLEGINATVNAIPAGADPHRKATAMKFRIDSPPVKIGEIHLIGASDTLSPEIGRITRHVTTDYDSAHSSQLIEDSVTAAYRDRGYAAAKVHAERSGKPVAGADAILVPFDVRVDEGRAYKLGSVQVASGLPVTIEEASKMLPSRDHLTPETRYAAAIRDAVSRLLKSKGYLDCSVTLTPTLDESVGAANYTINAVPGPVYHLGLLKFENVSDAMRALLMRSWQLMPGDPFNESYVSNFIMIAQKNDPALQRSLVGVKASYDVRSDPETRDVNVIIRLERQ